MLYGRQEIRVPNRDPKVSLQQIRYVIAVSVSRKLSSSCVFTHRNLCLSDQQIAWVLYGQASRAISIG